MSQLLLQFVKDDETKAKVTVSPAEAADLIYEVFPESLLQMPCIKELKQESLSFNEFAEAIRKIVVEILITKCGMQVYQFRSRDDDEVFVKVSCSDDIIKQMAVQKNYSMKLFIENNPLFEDYPPFTPYDPADDSKYESFKSVDGIRLMTRTLKDYININALMQNGILLAFFPLHEPAELKQMEKELLKIPKPIVDLPEDKICNYFGEHTCFYFCFLQHYTNALIIPSILGVMLWLLAAYVPNSFLHELGELVFSIFLAIWGTWFVKQWMRKESFMAVKYGTTNASDIEMVRSQYIGTIRKDPITGQPERYFAPKTRVRRQITSAISITFMIGLVIAAIFGIFVYRAILLANGDTFGPMVCAILNSIQIKVFNFVYDMLAVKLNNWENYRTETEYEDALILKLFAYQFINYYISLFYVAFFKEGIEGCDNGDCLGELGYNLWVMFAINIVFNFIEIGLPIVMHKVNMSNEDKRVAEIVKKNPEGARLKMGFVEYQGKLEDVSLLYEYLEIVMNYGYITFFCVAFPLGPLIYYICNLMEVYVDAYKMLKLSKRPYPRRVDDIGTWLPLLQFLAIISLITNAGIMVRYTEVFANTVWSFVIIEHVLVLTVLIIANYIPTISGFTTMLKKRHTHLTSEKHSTAHSFVIPDSKVDHTVNFDDEDN